MLFRGEDTRGALESAIGRLRGGEVAFLLSVCTENPDCGVATSPRIEYD